MGGDVESGEYGEYGERSELAPLSRPGEDADGEHSDDDDYTPGDDLDEVLGVPLCGPAFFAVGACGGFAVGLLLDLLAGQLLPAQRSFLRGVGVVLGCTLGMLGLASAGGSEGPGGITSRAVLLLLAVGTAMELVAFHVEASRGLGRDWLILVFFPTAVATLAFTCVRDLDGLHAVVGERMRKRKKGKKKKRRKGGSRWKGQNRAMHGRNEVDV